MKLRERQRKFVSRTVSHLKSDNNALGVAPTGAGKTVMMSAAIRAGIGHLDKKDCGDWHDGKGLVLQHRDELVTQNKKTMETMFGDVKTSVVNANIKDFSGDVTYAMVQSLANKLDSLPEVSILSIDEAHHSVAPTYRKIIDAVLTKNPNAKLLGVTATPNRSDCLGLRSVFSTVSDQITVSELVKSGHLVRPRCFAIDTGIIEEVKQVRRTSSGEYDVDAVAAIMDKRPINERVISEWEARAKTRQTVVFCATVDHAKHLAEMWSERGYKAAHIDGTMSDFQRKSILAAYDKREIQVLTNVMVLTEGWDNQPTSCVVLTRPLSCKGLMVQMIGRGLRKVDPQRYPGVRKDDCVVLDFGATLLAHGDLEAQVALESEGVVNCHECDALVPERSMECPLCGAELREPTEASVSESVLKAVNEKEELTDFTMTEIELLDASPFKWEDFFDGMVTICNAIDAWAAVINFRGRWHAIGGTKSGAHVICDSDDYVVALATADDFMRENGDTDKGRKTQRWITRPVTGRQAMILRDLGMSNGEILSMSSYRAACTMTWCWQKNKIRALVEVYNEQQVAA